MQVVDVKIKFRFEYLVKHQQCQLLMPLSQNAYKQLKQWNELQPLDLNNHSICSSNTTNHHTHWVFQSRM